MAKASRNRTLTLSDEERAAYKLQLLSENDLATGIDMTDSIINADLASALPFVPASFADLIIIDPPYNLTKDFNGTRFTSRSEHEYIDYVRGWLPDVVAKLKPTGSLYLCGDWKCTAALQQVLSEHLHIMNRITWQREKGRGATNNWKNGMEDIWFAVKDPHNYYFDVESVKQRRRVLAPYRINGEPKDWEATEEGNYRLTYPSNFWDDISIPFWSMPENTDHPTQKPEKLYAKLILASSREGDVVFDPFMGSGTTAIACIKERRHFIGFELSKEYFDKAVKRIDTERRQLTLF